jgi:beta-galactosidase
MLAGVLRSIGIPLGENLNSNHEDPDFLSDDIEFLLSQIRLRNNLRSIWGFKSPQAIELLPFYLRALRNPILMCIYRNPVSISKSYKKRSTESFRDCWALMRKHYEPLFRIFDFYNAPVILVPYEEAVMHKGVLVRELCEYFSIETTKEQGAVAMISDMGGGYRYLPGEKIEIIKIYNSDIDTSRQLTVTTSVVDMSQTDEYMVTESDDARIILVPNSNKFSQIHLLVDVKCDSRDLANAKIYVDVGEGFSETHVYRTSLDLGVNVFKISVDRAILGVRLDPCETAGVSLAFDQISLFPPNTLPNSMSIREINVYESSAGEQMRSQLPVTTLLHQWDVINPNFDWSLLSTAGVTHITFPLMWSRIEHNIGEFDWTYYDQLIGTLIAKGFKLILLLDAGGRTEFDETGSAVLDGPTVFPAWFRENIDYFARNFYQESVSQISFANTEALDHLCRFYRQTIGHYQAHYGQYIVGYAIGIQHEFEIKYSQNGYVWGDYSSSCVSEFKAISGRDPPVLDFGRSVVTSSEIDEAYFEWLQFRRKKLYECVERLTNIVHANGSLAYGYFGEFFTSHDGISSLAIVADLAELLDVAVLDYNFYDGWVRQSEVWKVPLMTNYAKALGYKKVYGGFYVERWQYEPGAPNSPVSSEIFPIVAASIFEAKNAGLIDGVEFGGFGNVKLDLRNLASPFVKAALGAPSYVDHTARSTSVCYLVGSHSTFDWYVGERAFDRNIHADALLRSYELLSRDPNIIVKVVSDELIVRKPEILGAADFVYLCHQPILDPRFRKALAVGFQKYQFVLIQDVRFGEWSTDGRYQDSWCSELFHLEGIGWQNGGDFIYRGARISMPAQKRMYASHALLSSTDTSRLQVKSAENPGEGLILRDGRVLVLGYIPALVEGPGAQDWWMIFLNEVESALLGRGNG